MDNYTLAKEVLAGKWGNGQERKDRLTAAGYDYMAVQTIVNALVRDRDTGSQTAAPAPVQDTPASPSNPLEIDYDPEINNGIIVNILYGKG